MRNNKPPAVFVAGVYDFGFLDWLDMPQIKEKPLKIQCEVFTKPEKELTKQEYERLVRAAQEKHNERLELLLQTICATGIRVSETLYHSAGVQSGSVY